MKGPPQLGSSLQGLRVVGWCDCRDRDMQHRERVPLLMRMVVGGSGCNMQL